MRISYHSSGSDDCPLLVLHSFAAQEVRRLIQMIQDLSQQKQTFKLKDDKSGIELSFEVSDSDKGVHEVKSNQFASNLTPSTYNEIASLLEPFLSIEPSAIKTRFQWLDESGDISMLFSTNGKW